MNSNEKSVLISLVDLVLMVVVIFAVIPFTIMIVWNVLVTEMFPLGSIGYGGAWAIMIIRSLFSSKKTEVKDDPKEGLKETLMGLAKAVFLVIATIIVGLCIGAI